MTSLPRTRLLLIVLTAVAVVGTVLAWTLLTAADRKVTLHAAEKGLAHNVALLEEQATTALRAQSLQLSRVADLIGDRPLHSLRGSAADRAALNRIRAENPSQHSIWIFDHNADLVLTSADLPEGSTMNAADRAYFSALRDGRERQFISPLIWGRLTGGLLFTMSRRLDNPDGSLRGVIAASIDADYFLSFYNSLGAGPDSVFTLLKEDGTIILRAPQPERPPDPAAIRGSMLWGLLAQQPAGQYQAQSAVDGVARLMAYKRVDGFPVIAIAGRSLSLSLAEWEKRAVLSGLVALAWLVLVLGLAVLAFHSLKGESAALKGEAEKARALEQALADKDVLFQEIHHRVKNNLQIISSLLTMQSLTESDAKVRSVLQEALDRIHSMGLVHHTLYLQQEASAVDMPSYLRSLVQSLGQSHAAAERGIALEVEADDIRLDLDHAVPLALAANEALTNALKHAFPTGRGGTVTAALRRSGETLELSIRDDGIGMPPHLLEGRRGSIGIHLLHSLARQIGGCASFDLGAGTTLRLAFAMPAAA